MIFKYIIIVFGMLFGICYLIEKNCYVARQAVVQVAKVQPVDGHSIGKSLQEYRPK